MKLELIKYVIRLSGHDFLPLFRKHYYTGVHITKKKSSHAETSAGELVASYLHRSLYLGIKASKSYKHIKLTVIKRAHKANPFT